MHWESVGHQPQTTAGELSDSHGQSARWTGGAVIESWHAPGSMTQNQVTRTLFFHWVDAGKAEMRACERENQPCLSPPSGPLGRPWRAKRLGKSCLNGERSGDQSVKSCLTWLMLKSYSPFLQQHRINKASAKILWGSDTENSHPGAFYGNNKQRW